MKSQFVTTVTAILLVGVTTIGVNLSVIGAMGEANKVRFTQIDARFEQMERRLDQMDRRFEVMDRRFEVMDRRMDEGFKEMVAAIARLEGLIHGLHGTAQTTNDPATDPERSS